MPRALDRQIGRVPRYTEQERGDRDRSFLLSNCQAPSTFPESTLRRLYGHVAHQLEQGAGEDSLGLGCRVKIIDGTSLSMPDAERADLSLFCEQWDAHNTPCRYPSGMDQPTRSLPACFRRAVVQDAAALAALAFRSKALWGYGAEFLERARPALTPSAGYLAHNPVYLLESAGQLIGFYGFQLEDGQAFLHDLFIAPEFVGRGYGRLLWAHLLGTAQRAGMRTFFIQSDPHAEGFYLRMGAWRVGERAAPETGRSLPLLRFDCPASPRS